MLPPLDRPKLAYWKQHVRHLARNHLHRHRPVCVAVQSHLFPSITLHPHMALRHRDSGGRVWLARPYNVTLQPNDSLDGYNFWILRASIQQEFICHVSTPAFFSLKKKKTPADGVACTHINITTMPLSRFSFAAHLLHKTTSRIVVVSLSPFRKGYIDAPFITVTAATWSFIHAIGGSKIMPQYVTVQTGRRACLDLLLAFATRAHRDVMAKVVGIYPAFRAFS